MDSEQYKEIIGRSNVLDYGTLKVTREELVIAGEVKIALEIERILKKNAIDKPNFHNKIEDQETTYSAVDISSDEREIIVSLLGDGEVSSLGPDYETTGAASFYAGLLDKWNSE